ncbi:MAG: L,D-transpeptidase [Pseudorhodoplanes sp.]
MHRLVLVALLANACGLSAAFAQGMPPAPSYFAASDQDIAPPPPTRASYRASQGDMGGGFIEFIFGDPRRQPTAAPRARFEPSLPVDAPSPGVEQQAVMPPPVYSPSPAAVAPVRRGVDSRFLPQEVAYSGPEKPGTIVIDTPSKYLYLVEESGRARRYGIGVGRPGFTWAGVKTVSMKREWPDWRPPEEMLQRRPDLPRWMPGGPDNPLGARALYLGSSLYRIHGSNEPWTIGQQVSSGCIRMRNEDVIDLYERVKIGTRVVVI